MQGEPILIVDDDVGNLKLSWVLLSSRGYEVRTAGDAEEALRVLKRFSPRLILIDLQLPGMDGLELARTVKAEPSASGAVILALTTTKEDEEIALAAGCVGCIPKPIDLRRLPAQVAEYLRRPV